MRHIMMGLAHIRRTSHCATAHALALWPCWVALLTIGLVAVSPSIARAAQAPISGAASGSAAPALPFAIADFDGDRRPDLASIQTGESTQSDAASDCSYWIQLRLSSSGRRLIRLVAPAGGLLIEARDVNGDHAIDLVFATAWFRRPVAIFLNDGHGTFSRVAPAAFPSAFAAPRADWSAFAQQSVDAAGVAQDSRNAFSLRVASFAVGRSHTGDALLSNAAFLPDFSRSLRSARAPPAVIPSV
jgi:hypothetical protein